MARRGDIEAARTAFERFHSKQAGEPAYPFHKEDVGEFEHDVKVGPMAHVGKALRVLYRSDKWHRPGATTDYYHDHGQGPSTKQLVSNVRFWLPAKSEEANGLDAEPLPYEWPEAVTILGECIGWHYQPFDAEGDEVVEGSPKGCLLVASPDGYVDPRKPDLCFLAIVNAETGQVEGFIEGPGLRNTADGIDG